MTFPFDIPLWDVTAVLGFVGGIVLMKLKMRQVLAELYTAFDLSLYSEKELDDLLKVANAEKEARAKPVEVPTQMFEVDCSCPQRENTDVHGGS